MNPETIDQYNALLDSEFEKDDPDQARVSALFHILGYQINTNTTLAQFHDSVVFMNKS